MNSAEQLNRVVQLVSELTRRDREGSPGAELRDLAARFGVTPSQIQADVRALTHLSDSAGSDWLLSLRVSQEGSTVSVNSGGAFQRPLRLTRDELMAVQIGLAGVAERSQLADRLRPLLRPAGPDLIALPDGNHGVLQQALAAIRDGYRLRLRYVRLGSPNPSERVVHPYEVVGREGHHYLVAWCELAAGWRFFRLDRVLELTILPEPFSRRDDFVPREEVFEEPPGGVDSVQVRFGPAVSRWIREQHPDAVTEPDGAVTVTYRVADPDWLVRHVLQYGEEAVVVAPDSYRELMRRALEG